MIKRKQRIFVVLATLALLVPLQACSRYPSTYSAEAIEGWVVDGETKKPLEGVIATANWQLEIGTVGGNVPAGQMMVMETVTDKNGRFYFSGWGPKRRPRGDFSLLASRPHLVHRDPQLLLFKRGYRYHRLQNKVVTDYNKGPLRKSDWNGKAIELKKFTGSAEEYARSFERFNNELGHIVADNPEHCYWKDIPRTVMSMQRQRELLEKKGINPHTLSTIDERLFTNDEYFSKKGTPPCGSPKEFFQKFKR